MQTATKIPDFQPIFNILLPKCVCLRGFASDPTWGLPAPPAGKRWVSPLQRAPQNCGPQGPETPRSATAWSSPSSGLLPPLNDVRPWPHVAWSSPSSGLLQPLNDDVRPWPHVAWSSPSSGLLPPLNDVVRPWPHVAWSSPSSGLLQPSSAVLFLVVNYAHKYGSLHFIFTIFNSSLFTLS